MELWLQRMIMDNFKGTKHLEVCFGQETRIAGRNGIGKSTIADAFFWVLLGSDSHGNAPGSNNFREKPLDEDGREIHNLTTAVTLDCTLDGQPFQLRREQTENWVKKRGQAEAVFSGNVSSWWINGVERKANDFKAAVASITSTDVFCYIAMLSAFNQADVKTRRSVLVGMSDGDIASHLLEAPEYGFIKAETAAKNIKPEELQKVLKDRLKLQNAELKMIPARADEARRLIPDMQEADVEKARQTVDKAAAATEELDRKIAAAMAADTGAALLERIADARRRVEERRSELSTKHLQALCEHRAKIAKCEEALTAAKQSLAGKQAAFDKAERMQAEQSDMAQQLRLKWKAVRAETFAPPQVSSICPTCHQAIPPEQVQQAIDHAKDAFEQDKLRRLGEISKQGKAAADYAASLTQVVTNAKNEADAQKQAVREAQGALQAVEGIQMSAQPDYAADKQLTALNGELEALTSQQGVAQRSAELEHLRQQKAQIVLAADKARDTLSAWKTAQDARKRVAELEQQQRNLGNSVAEIEKQIMLVERFLRDRCALLEESINANFPTVRWKLFDQQINGGIAETCICMVPCGNAYVPYPTANTASQLLSDLEIVDVLSKRYDTKLPVFFDNRERVNVLPPVDAQLITLSVTHDDPIKVEIVKA